MLQYLIYCTKHTHRMHNLINLGNLGLLLDWGSPSISFWVNNTAHCFSGSAIHLCLHPTIYHVLGCKPLLQHDNGPLERVGNSQSDTQSSFTLYPLCLNPSTIARWIYHCHKKFKHSYRSHFIAYIHSLWPPAIWKFWPYVCFLSKEKNVSTDCSNFCSL